MDKDPPVFLKETTLSVVELQDIHIAYLIMIKTFASLTFVEHLPTDSFKNFHLTNHNRRNRANHFFSTIASNSFTVQTLQTNPFTLLFLIISNLLRLILPLFPLYFFVFFITHPLIQNSHYHIYQGNRAINKQNHQPLKGFNL